VNISWQPTMVPMPKDHPAKALTVRYADDADREIAMFNVLIDPPALANDAYTVYARRLDTSSKVIGDSLGSGTDPEAALASALQQMAPKVQPSVEKG
jgi:hypothetical protein